MLLFFYSFNSFSMLFFFFFFFKQKTAYEMRISDWSSDVCSSDLDIARASSGKPTLICCKTLIGFGSPNKQGKESSHGAALGEAEVALAREKLGWPPAPFEIQDALAKGWEAKAQGAVAEPDRQGRLQDYARTVPARARVF